MVNIYLQAFLPLQGPDSINTYLFESVWKIRKPEAYAILPDGWLICRWNSVYTLKIQALYLICSSRIVKRNIGVKRSLLWHKLEKSVPDSGALYMFALRQKPVGGNTYGVQFR